MSIVHHTCAYELLQLLESMRSLNCLSHRSRMPLEQFIVQQQQPSEICLKKLGRKHTHLRSCRLGHQLKVLRAKSPHALVFSFSLLGARGVPMGSVFFHKERMRERKIKWNSKWVKQREKEVSFFKRGGELNDTHTAQTMH